MTTANTTPYKRFFTRADGDRTGHEVNCILYGTLDVVRYVTSVYECPTIIDRGEGYPAGRYRLMLLTDEIESDDFSSLEKLLKEWMEGEHEDGREITFETIRQGERSRGHEDLH